MSFGLFTGTGMEVRAEENYTYVKVAANETEAEVCQKALCDLNYNYYDSSDEVIVAIKKWAQEVEPESTLIICYSAGNYYDYAHSDSNRVYESISFGRPWSDRGNIDKLYVLTVPSTQKPGLDIPVDVDVRVTEQKANDVQESNAEQDAGDVHTHSYSWVTVQEAAVGQDGIEEYRCSCGDVQGRNVIPASAAFVDGFYDEIMNAPQNGTATFDSGWLCTLSDAMIKKLAERTDVTTVITFEYQKQSYRMTIPAGADFASLLADEERFYGYFYFANVVGATIEAL